MSLLFGVTLLTWIYGRRPNIPIPKSRRSRYKIVRQDGKTVVILSKVLPNIAFVDGYLIVILAWSRNHSTRYNNGSRQQNACFYSTQAFLQLHTGKHPPQKFYAGRS